MTAAPGEPRKPWLGPGLTAGFCAALLVVFAALSYSAALKKSATYDEPLHVLGGFLHRHYKDFRVNPEDPALFGWLVSLPNPKSSLTVDLTNPRYGAIVEEVGHQWPFIWQTLYQTRGNDEQRVLNRSRAVCTAVGVILGALIAAWSYRLAGGAAAVGATALYALCPNFLAHASVVKNDVTLSCVLLAVCYTTWLVGRRASPLRLAALALLCGAALGVKYSGVLAGPVVALLLAVRALMPWPWEFVRLNLDTRGKRLAAALAACAACAVVAYGTVWAAYGFRFRPTPAADVYFNMSNLERLAKIKQLQARHERARMRIEARGETPTEENLPPITERAFREHRPPLAVRSVLWMNERGVLPQGWLAGFLYTFATTQLRSTYLNGEIQNVGRWEFFPLAMLYKTPAATLVAALGAAAVTLVIGRLKPKRLRAGVAAPATVAARELPRLDAWAHVCLWVAPILYGLSALSANLNLGLRHILPVYPFLFIGIGVVVAKVVARWRAIGFVAVELLALLLMIETLAAYPDFIAFFNVFAGGSRGGLALLGDSNLDWGQDLKALAQWQRENPGKKLYLSYFGIADPAYYGVKAQYLPGGYVFATSDNPQRNPDPGEPAVIAVSATNLQGIYFDPATRVAYHQMQLHEPLNVLGGSIYLYTYPFTTSTLKEPPPGGR